MRSFQAEEDYWRIRQFLRQVSLLNDRHDFSWSLLRWDYWRWHVNENIFHFNLQDVITLWEENGQIVAVLNPDGSGEAFFQIHPAFKNDGILSEMLNVAEQKLPNLKENGKKELIVWVNAADDSTKQLFTQRGYSRSKFLAEHMRRRFFTQPIPDSVSQSGYAVRALGDESELPARSWLSWKVFHSDEPDEKYQGWEWYRNVQCVPIYRRDLDIVAVAPDGDLAAFCTVWFDDITRTAVFEPVGTHPNHQKRGLGKMVVSEGLRRAHKLGATLATVSSYSPAAYALYDSMGFKEFDLLEPWVKEW
ncbi:GNAT family N-acetyltransferase [Candidatus Villigracilis affinis]|uniref:GNAT family N-acetyltransferase n=1 Tax=Candidatus Villigracilis affinis TaxID=3140682 RepID=UPI0031EC8260